MPSVLVILNRNAHRLEHAGPGTLRDAIVDAAHAHGAEVRETRLLADLEAATREAAARDVDRVVLAGGDGSYMAGVTALVGAFANRPIPAIAFAPGGTVSTVARNWGMRGNAKRVAARVVRAACDPRAQIDDRPSLRVKDDASDPDRIGFIFGAGLVASFFDVYYASPHQGYEGAARIVARIFAGSFTGGALAARVLTPVPCRLKVDGAEAIPRAWSLVLASVVRDVGLHMHVTYRAGERFDRFHAVASALAPRALGPQMPRVLLGRMLRGEHHVDAMTKELALAFEGDGSYVLDGDVLAARRVTVTPGPVLRVVRA